EAAVLRVPGDRDHRVRVDPVVAGVVDDAELHRAPPTGPPAAIAPIIGAVMEFTVPMVTADDHVLGPAGAPVTVLEYGDYECPFCRGAARDVRRMLEEYPGLILFAFRNFPIAGLHPHAEQAAEAAEAAAAQGKFWPMYEILLRPSTDLS